MTNQEKSGSARDLTLKGQVENQRTRIEELERCLESIIENYQDKSIGSLDDSITTAEELLRRGRC